MRITNLLASSLLLAAGCHDDPPKPSPDGPVAVDPHDIVVHITNFYTGAGSNAQLLALQDGDGAWTVLTGTNGDYHAHVASDRYAVMTSCKYDATFSDVSLYYRHVSDGPLAEYGCESAATPLKVTVVGANVPTGDSLRVRMQSGGSLMFTSGANGTLATLDAAKGTLDGVAIVRDASFATLGVLRVPTTDLQADKTITFDAAMRIASTATPLTMTNLGATPTGAVVSTSITTAHGSFPLSTTSYQAAAPFTFSTPPQSFFGTGELLNVSTTVDDGRSAAATLKAVGAVSLALPTAGIKTSNVSLVTTPYARPTFTFSTTAKTLAHQSYNLYAFDTNAGIFADYSSAYVGTAATVTFAMPDFSGLAGFDPTHVPSATNEIDWSVSRDETNGVVGDGAVSQGASSNDAPLGAYCGNGHVDAGEACDDAGESATCDDDCTAVACGDGTINFTAGEECEPPNVDTCDATCKLPPAAHATRRAPTPTTAKRLPAGAPVWKVRR